MSKKKLNTETGEIIDIKEPVYYNTSRNYRTRRNIDFRTTERNDGISLTTPNMAFTNREIINRFAAGIPIQGFMIPSYETDGSTEATDTFSMETYKAMDYEERQAFMDKILAQKAEAEKQMKLTAKKQIEARQEKERQEWLKNQIELINKQKNTGQNSGDMPPQNQS